MPLTRRPSPDASWGPTRRQWLRAAAAPLTAALSLGPRVGASPLDSAALGAEEGLGGLALLTPSELRKTSLLLTLEHNLLSQRARKVVTEMELWRRPAPEQAAVLRGLWANPDVIPRGVEELVPWLPLRQSVKVVQRTSLDHCFMPPGEHGRRYVLPGERYDLLVGNR